MIKQHLRMAIDDAVDLSMKSIERNLRAEVEIAFMRGVELGMAESKRIQEKIFDRWEKKQYESESLSP